ncbi:Holliday junction resolvase [Verrucomicrobia bacterium IMCC26134]|jgi:putative Holliday junction resolvase|nr:Holliday junction resolvase [Verrucomicrobia bacterium IMCC26134]
MRFLGIDYGTRRIGLATGDELGVATPIPALVDAELVSRRLALAAVVRQRRIDEIVIGYPLNMDGTAGYKARETDAVAAELRAEFGLPVHLVDERLTSHIAEQGMNQKQLREIRAKGIIDSRAAAVILQDYLDQRFPPGLVPPPEA